MGRHKPSNGNHFPQPQDPYSPHSGEHREPASPYRTSLIVATLFAWLCAAGAGTLITAGLLTHRSLITATGVFCALSCLWFTVIRAITVHHNRRRGIYGGK